MSTAKTKAALVTGAARGIGLATAKRFLADGWNVALLDIDEATLDRTHAALAGSSTSFAIHCDVAERTQVADAFATVARQFGRLDALVNNAGIAIFKPILDVTYEDWSRVLAVNLTGPFLCTQAAAPLMRDSGGGAIVNITSKSGLRASTLRAAYGTSNAGLAHLTQQQAIELAALGIRVNAVAPGPVDTAMAKAVHTPDIRAAYHEASHSIVMAWKKSLPRRSSFCAATGRATSPGRPSRSTAALKPPASACRRCAKAAAIPKSGSRRRTGTPKRAASGDRGTSCGSPPSSRVARPAHAACRLTPRRCRPARPNAARRSRWGCTPFRDCRRGRSRL